MTTIFYIILLLLALLHVITMYRQTAALTAIALVLNGIHKTLRKR